MFDGKRNTRNSDRGPPVSATKGARQGKFAALGYFRNNRRRMNYYHLALQGYPIGSGEVEAANKVLVTQRLKRFSVRNVIR